MATNERLTYARLSEVLRRQDPPQWGSQYDPGVRATREEAPSLSRFQQLWSEKLQRYVHSLARSTESPAIMLALMNPALFELQEQRMLPMEARPHPLSAHPVAAGMDLPPMRGTVIVAERLDLFHHHRWLRHREKENGDVVLPFPFFGDLLLFLLDEVGPYCLNWTIKKSEEDFSRSISVQKRVRNPEADERDERARHAIEELLYQDADIRTIRVVKRMIGDNLAHNLRNLFLNQAVPVELTKDVIDELDDRLKASFTTREKPLDILLAIAHRHNCAFEHLRCAFFNALWHRRVRADLVDEPILIDRPLRPERADLFEQYSFLFARKVA